MTETRGFDSPKLDWILAVLFFFAALAIRLPNFMEVPRYADEGFEVLWGLDFALGKHLPLTGYTTHYGPFFAYLMAFLFLVFGIHLELPRLTTTIFGALAVAMTYGLGRVMWNRMAGIIGAGFALTNPALIIYGSHHDWSASLTPFFATATLTTMYAGIVHRKNGLLILSGLLAALTMQSHPASIVILFASALWFFHLPDWKVRIKERTGLVAVLLFLVGYAPMIIAWARILNPFGTALDNVSSSLSLARTPQEYLTRLIEFLKVTGYTFGGGYGQATIFLRVQAVLVEILLIASIVRTWRLRLELISLILVVSIGLLTFFLGELSERYYLFLFPLAFVAIGVFVTKIARWAGNALVQSSGIRRMALSTLRFGLPVLVLALVAIPVNTLARYYAEAFTAGATNQEYFRLLAVVRQNRACEESLLVEDAPEDFSTLTSTQSWYALHAIDYVLRLDQCAHRMLPREELARALKPSDRVVISEPSFAELTDRTRFENIAKINPPLVVEQRVPILFLQVTRW